MRPLPVLVDPFVGETVGSVYRRLAFRNAVPTGELWTAIRHAHPRLPLRTTPELVPHVVEELADLPARFLDGRPADRLFVRCIHANWRHTNCATCAPLPAPATKCRRCTRGEPAEVRTRTGAVCTRHRRWHYAGADGDLSTSVDHLRAERCLTGTLWQRGIGLDTGELELATMLIALHSGQDPDDGPRHEALARHYPEAVQLVALLTEVWAERFLSNTNVGLVPVAALVEAAVTAVSARTPRHVAAVRASFRTEGREAVVGTKQPVRLRHGRSPGLGELGTRILPIAPRVRATFLRHTNARNPPTQQRRSGLPRRGPA